MKKSAKKNQGKIKPYSGRAERRLQAFLMRFVGHTYEQIARETGWSIHTLYHYFSKKGRWYDAYQKWAADREDDVNDRVSKVFVAQSVETAQQLINISRGHLKITIGEDKNGKPIMAPVSLKGDTILRAAMDVLDRAGFKPVEKHQVQADIEDQAESELATLEKVKAVMERKYKKKNEPAKNKPDS